MFCHKCGNKVEDGSLFCDNCGAPLIENPATIEPPKAQFEQPKAQFVQTSVPEFQYFNNKRTGIYNYIAALLMLFIILAILFNVGGSKFGFNIMLLIGTFDHPLCKCLLGSMCCIFVFGLFGIIKFLIGGHAPVCTFIVVLSSAFLLLFNLILLKGIHFAPQYIAASIALILGIIDMVLSHLIKRDQFLENYAND